MPYKAAQGEPSVQNSGTSFTVVLPAGQYEVGDLLAVCVSNDGGGTTISTATAGWTNVGTFAASGNSAQRWALKIAASTSETDPVFTVANATVIGVPFVFRDVDPNWISGGLTSGVDYVRTDYNNVQTTNSGALTTPDDDRLLIYSWNSDGADQYMRCKTEDLIGLSKVQQNSAQQHIIGYRQQGAAGAAPTVTMYHSVATEGGNGWVIAIKNKTNGLREKDCRGGLNELAWYGSWNAVNLVGAPTWNGPDDIASTPIATINSITVSSTAPTINNGATQALTPWGKNTTLTSTENTAGAWVGGSHTITSTDMTGKILSVQWETDASSLTTRVGAEGALLLLGDETNWVAYQLLPKSALSANTPFSAQIAVGNATVYDSSGSINLAAVTRVGYVWHRIGSTATSSQMAVKNLCLMGSAVITGGGTGRAVDNLILKTCLDSWGNYRLVDKQGAKQIVGKASVQVGDGTNKTIFDSGGSSFEFPIARDTSGEQQHWNGLASSVAYTVKASANDNISFAASLMGAAVSQAFTIDAASSTSATYSFAGSSSLGYTVTWKTGVACEVVTFKDGHTIDFKGADPVSVIVSGGLDDAQATVSDGFSATSSTFTAGGSAIYALRIAAAGTYSLESTTFSGFTKDIDVTAASGTVTINLAAGQATPTYQTAGATVNIVASPVFQTVSITNLVVGSRVQIYDTTSSTELYNAVPAGTTATWTDSNPATASRAIRVRIAYVSGTTAKAFIEANIGTCGTVDGTEAVSYLANQTNDTTYNTNAIDGSGVTGITFTDAATDLVNINLAGGSSTWPNIYAAFVYWIGTATGITDDIAYISAPDTANYLLTAMKVKNTSSPSVPLTITGGFGRDATSGTIVDIVDTTGGNVYPLVDHVVAFATGTVLTAGQDATLSAIKSATDAYLDATVSSRATSAGVLSAAQSTPIHADLRKINGNAGISGTGTEADPWGPA